MEIIWTVAPIALIIFFVIEIRRALRRSRRTVELIDRYLLDRNEQTLVDDILEFVTSDRRLRRILEKHGAGREEIAGLHKKLMIWGDFRKYNRYVPITSFFYASALDYLLEHRDDDPKALTEKMMNYFHF